MRQRFVTELASQQITRLLTENPKLYLDPLIAKDVCLRRAIIIPQKSKDTGSVRDFMSHLGNDDLRLEFLEWYIPAWKRSPWQRE